MQKRKDSKKVAAERIPDSPPYTIKESFIGSLLSKNYEGNLTYIIKNLLFCCVYNAKK